MKARSLRRELLGWLLLPLAAVVCFNVWTTYRTASDTADLITDRTLLASARAISENIRQYDGVLEAPIPPAALEMFASDRPDKVVYRVTTPRGVIIAGYPDVIPPPRLPTVLEPVYYSSTFRGEAVRAVAIAQPIVTGTDTGAAAVAVGQTLQSHDRLVTSLWLKALRDQVFLVAAAGLLALFGLHRGLARVTSLRDAVVKRDPSALKPFETKGVQSELRPLVEALNHAFSNVQRQVAIQRRFVANAAHQLRHPLALMKTQAKVGLRAASIETKDEALVGIDAAVDRMTHLSNQLLALARAEQGSDLLHKQTVDFAEIAREAVASVAQLALSRAVDLGFSGNIDLPAMRGHPVLLREMVVNLIDNAVRYTPSGGVVTASLRREDGSILFRAEDTGPGIPEEDRGRVFDRFYRRLGADPGGNGLGLAIVREIVLAHGGSIRLAERTPPPGLLAEVRLPLPG